jgi:hypothetical protein
VALAGLRRALTWCRPTCATDPPALRRVVDDGYLCGRGAGHEERARGSVAAMARLARRASASRGSVAARRRRRGGLAHCMRWLLEHRPDIRPDYALNEGDGLRLELTDGRAGWAVGDKGITRRGSPRSARRRTPDARAGPQRGAVAGRAVAPGGERALTRIPARWSTAWSRSSRQGRARRRRRLPLGLAPPRPCTRRSSTWSQPSPASRWPRRCSPGRASAT